MQNDSEFELFQRAATFALRVHSGQMRKGDRIPFILHPMEAASIAGSITKKPEVLAAAVLHDVVEDAGISLEEVKKEFGERVAELVASETENKRKDLPAESTWQLRKQEALRVITECNDPDIKVVWLGDKLSNMRSFYRLYTEEGDGMFRYFHQKDKAMHRWYYGTIAEALSEFRDTPAWQEYTALIDKVFGE